MRTQKTKDIKFLSFRVSREFWIRVGQTARRLGVTAQAFCIEAIQKHMDRADKKNGNGEDLNGPPARAVIDQIRKAPTNTTEE